MLKKFNFIYSLLALLFIGSLFINFASNPPNGRTGAPGDGVCSDCHGGGPFSGTLDISGLPATIAPSTTYSITVTSTENAANKAGFQLVALDASNTNIGSISNVGTDATMSSSGGRTYVEHNPAPSFGAGNSISWTFDWTSPASPDGETITMYAASVFADGNGNSTVDQVVTTNVSGTLDITVPIELAEFKLKIINDETIDLIWVTLTESNNDYFTLQRSNNGVDWKAIHTEEGQGSSIEKNIYKYTDRTALAGKFYYRLKQTDFDGSYSYSNILTAELKQPKERINIYPNPTADYIYFQYLDIEKEVKAEVLDYSGRIVYSGMVANNSLDLSQLSTGIYSLMLYFENITISKSLVIIEK